MTTLPFVGLLLLDTSAPDAATWFTPATLFTAAGSTVAVIAVTSVLQRFSPKVPAAWFALGLSEILAIVAVSVQNKPWNPANVLLAILNGIMTYAAAVGVNTAATTPPPPPAAGAKAVAGRSYRWWA